jgi:hypothetical protein
VTRLPLIGVNSTCGRSEHRRVKQVRNGEGASGTTTNCPLSATGNYSIANTALGTATLSFTGSSVSSAANADGIEVNGCLLVPPQISISIGVAQQGNTLVFQMAPGASNVNFWGSGSKQ